VSSLRDVISGDNTVLKQPALKRPSGGGMTSNGELMREARRALEGNWAIGIAGNIFFNLLALSSSIFFYAAILYAVTASLAMGAGLVAIFGEILAGGLVLGILEGIFVVGFCSFYLSIAQGKAADLSDLFSGFKRLGTCIGAFCLMGLFILLWSFLLVLPGIIAAFRYAMVFFIIADDCTAGPLEAIRKSKQMMKGNKWKFFCLHWRFLGWTLISLLTCGIGFLWLLPYMQTTLACFYEDVK